MTHEKRSGFIPETESKETRPEMLVEQWKAEPVFLVSTSQYRLEAMKTLGFRDVQSLPSSDDVEQQAFRAYHEAFGKISDPMEFGSSAPEQVAKEKLSEAVKEFLQARPEMSGKFFAAFDTMAHHYQYHLDRLLAVGMNKPANEEDAARVIRSVCSTMMRMCMIRHSLQNEAQKERAFSLNIKTGMAVKLPDENEVRVTSVKIYLHPRAVYALADAFQPAASFDDIQTWSDEQFLEQVPLEVQQTLDKMVRDVLNAMRKVGRDVTKVAGGIDYTIPEVRSVLGIDDEIDEGILRGFPARRFDEWLLKIAEERIGKAG